MLNNAGSNQNGVRHTASADVNDDSFNNLRKERPNSLSLNGVDDLNKLNCEQIQDRLENAQKRSNKEDEAKYALLLSAKYVSMGNYSKSLNVINKFNVLLVLEETRKLMLRISTKLYAMEDLRPDNLELWRLLRDTLFNLFTSKSIGNQFADELEKHLLIAHYLYLKNSLTNYLKQLNEVSNLNGNKIASTTNGNLNSNSTNNSLNNSALNRMNDSAKSSSMLNLLNELNLKLSIALLRYTDLVRVDYLFYEAGQLCKQSSKLNLAFIFLNHFLDLVDAIEEQDANLVDYTNLEQTDIPFKVPLPSTVFLHSQGDQLNATAEAQIEQIKSWILEKSMDNNNFNLFHNNDVNDNSYEASLLKNDGSQSVYLPCLVTGYPVLDKEHFQLKPGKYAANRSDWNNLLMIIKVYF